jgi:hypothetical protein
MAGTFLRLAPPRMFDFTDLRSDGEGPVNAWAVLADRLNALHCREGLIVVRAKLIDIDANDKLYVRVLPDPFTPMDPGAAWEEFDQDSPLATVTFSASDNGKLVYRNSSFSNPPPLIQVVAEGKRATAATSPNGLKAVFWVELALRD